MTRLRRASVIAVLSVLAWAATARAECAWVLWQESESGSGRWALDSGVEVSFSAKADCEKQRDARFEFVARMQEQESPSRHSATPFFLCLPDTVDPRGPKGK